MPGVAVSSNAFVVAIVVALTFLMWLALRETFGAQRRITERLVTFPLYFFSRCGRSASVTASGGA